MKLMRQVLARLAPCRAMAMLWSAGALVVLLSACGTHTEPLIHRVQVEVTREAPVNATRVAAAEVEVTSQAPVEVTRIVSREVEVTRVVPTVVVREVTKVVVATPTAKARPTLRPATASPRPIPTATRKPTDTPRPTSVSAPQHDPTPTVSLSVGPPPNPFAGLFAPPEPGLDPTPTIGPDMPGPPPDFLKELQRILNSLSPEEAFAELIANNNLIRVWTMPSQTSGYSPDEQLFFDPRPEFYVMNTLDLIIPGVIYLVEIQRDQRGVYLGGESVDLYSGLNLMEWPTAER